MKKSISTFVALLVCCSAFSQWSNLVSGTTETLRAPYFINDTVGWVVGTNGTILKTTDGNTFTAQVSGTGNDLYSATFLNSTTGFVVGDSSTILKTTDGGGTWIPVTTPYYTNYRFVWFLDSTTGFIVGGLTGGTGMMLKTTDGGSTWNFLAPGLSGAICGVFFTDMLTGYVCDSTGSIIKTTDGGVSWTSQTSGVTTPLHYIYFTDSYNGYAVGGGGAFLKTTDGGATWVNNLVLPSVNLYHIRFVTASYGYTVGWNNSGGLGRVYKTYDYGATWSINYSAGFDLMFLASFQGTTGYATGENGKIIKIPYLSFTGLDRGDEKLHKINLFPSPAKHIIHLNFELEKEEIVGVELFDLLGRPCLSLPLENHCRGVHELMFDTETLENGVYTVKISIGRSTETKTVVVAH